MYTQAQKLLERPKSYLPDFVADAERTITYVSLHAMIVSAGTDYASLFLVVHVQYMLRGITFNITLRPTLEQLRAIDQLLLDTVEQASYISVTDEATHYHRFHGFPRRYFGDEAELPIHRQLTDGLRHIFS